MSKRQKGTGLVLRGVVVILLMFHLYCALMITGLLPGYEGSYYGFTVPHMAVVSISILMIITTAVIYVEELCFLSFVCLALLLPTYYFALHEWPGGDDGPGMGWFFVIGGLSLLNTILGIPFTYIAYRIDRKREEAEWRAGQ